eukprot:314738-Prymnesium_polylepis.1
MRQCVRRMRRRLRVWTFPGSGVSGLGYEVGVCWGPDRSGRPAGSNDTTSVPMPPPRGSGGAAVCNVYGTPPIARPDAPDAFRSSIRFSPPVQT